MKLARELMWLLPFTLVGAFLRLWDVDGQILGGDELHEIRVALRTPLSELPFHYGRNGTSPPLLLFYALLLGSGLTISELGLRVPALASGIALLVLGPLFVRRLLDQRSAIVLGWLLAISPILVLYSRIARSYAPIALLGLWAAYASYRWLQDGRTGFAFAYAVLAPLTIYFHLLAMPFVLAPLLFVTAEKLAFRNRRQVQPSWRSLCGVSAGILALACCFLVPARDELLGLLRMRVGSGASGAEALIATFQLQSGSRNFAVEVLFVAAAAWGVVSLCRRRRRFAYFTLTLVVGQVAAIFVVSPTSVDQAIVLNRYLIISLPIILVWVAYGIASATRGASSGGQRLLRNAAAGGFVGLLLFAGPLPLYFSEGATAFLGHSDFVVFGCQARARPGRVPEFYTRLNDQDRADTIVEFPWGLSWDSTHFPYVYHVAHGQKIIVSTPFAIPDHPNLRFRNAVDAEVRSLTRTGASFLVVHHDLVAEEESFMQPRGCLQPTRGLGAGRVRQSLARQIHPSIQRFREALGEPVFEDDVIQVWDLRKR